APHPVQPVRDAGEDYPSRGASTQVSLLPPPWEGLTTSEPSRGATGVGRPGGPSAQHANAVAVEDERAQVHPARLEAATDVSGMRGELHERLRDVVARILLHRGQGGLAVLRGRERG